DAGGRMLPSRIEVEGRTIGLEVDDTHARYPVTIDPVVQSANLMPSDLASGDQYGAAVAIDGATAAIGAPQQNSEDGAVYVLTRTVGVWGTPIKITPPQAGAANNRGWTITLTN